MAKYVREKGGGIAWESYSLKATVERAFDSTVFKNFCEYQQAAALLRDAAWLALSEAFAVALITGDATVLRGLADLIEREKKPIDPVRTWFMQELYYGRWKTQRPSIQEAVKAFNDAKVREITNGKPAAIKTSYHTVQRIFQELKINPTRGRPHSQKKARE